MGNSETRVLGRPPRSATTVFHDCTVEGKGPPSRMSTSLTSLLRRPCPSGPVVPPWIWEGPWSVTDLYTGTVVGDEVLYDYRVTRDW